LPQTLWMKLRLEQCGTDMVFNGKKEEK